MPEAWDGAATGVLMLPAGRLVRGRGVGGPLPPGPVPEFGVHLLGRRPAAQPWESRWAPGRTSGCRGIPTTCGRRCGTCWRVPAANGSRSPAGAHGRTGTALACLAVLDGLPADRAVAYVRAHYRRRAVETPGQRALVARFVPGP